MTEPSLCERFGRHDEIVMLATTVSVGGVTIRCLRCPHERYVTVVVPSGGRASVEWATA